MPTTSASTAPSTPLTMSRERLVSIAYNCVGIQTEAGPEPYSRIVNAGGLSGLSVGVFQNDFKQNTPTAAPYAQAVLDWNAAQGQTASFTQEQFTRALFGADTDQASHAVLTITGEPPHPPFGICPSSYCAPPRPLLQFHAFRQDPRPSGQRTTDDRAAHGSGTIVSGSDELRVGGHPNSVKPHGMRFLAVRLVAALGVALCASCAATRDAAPPPPAKPVPASFPREVLEAECFNLPYGVDEATFRACIVEAAKTFLPPFDPAHPEDFGREYDPAKYLDCMQKSPMHIERPITRNRDKWQTIVVHNHTECRKYRRLKPHEPEVWPGPERPSLPPLPDGRPYDPPSPDMEDKRRLHALSTRYFERLCKSEAKEVILRTADDVEGVYFIRPNVAVKAQEYVEPHLLEHLVTISDLPATLAPFRPPTAPDISRKPNWYVERVGKMSALKLLIEPSIVWPPRNYPVKREDYQAKDFGLDESQRYRYIEFPRWDAPPGDFLPYMRATRNPRLQVAMSPQPGSRMPPIPSLINTAPIFEAIALPQSRYGITWRGFEPSPGDRKLGIYGNEFLIVDFVKNEVMAYTRTFAFSGQPSGKSWARNGGWLDNAMSCRDSKSPGGLLKRTLKPKNNPHSQNPPAMSNAERISKHWQSLSTLEQTRYRYLMSLAQVASEAYGLTPGMADDDLDKALSNGNSAPAPKGADCTGEPSADGTERRIGSQRMTNSQIADFKANFNILAAPSETGAAGDRILLIEFRDKALGDFAYPMRSPQSLSQKCRDISNGG